jgi:hypothetical protein
MTPLMPQVKASMLRTLSDAIEIVRGLPERRDCEACDHLVNGVCRRWSAAPPAKVLPVGCDAFESTIPF